MAFARAAFLFVSFALVGAALQVSPASGVETVLRAHAEKHDLAVDYFETPGRAFEFLF